MRAPRFGMVARCAHTSAINHTRHALRPRVYSLITRARTTHARSQRARRREVGRKGGGDMVFCARICTQRTPRERMHTHTAAVRNARGPPLMSIYITFRLCSALPIRRRRRRRPVYICTHTRHGDFHVTRARTTRERTSNNMCTVYVTYTHTPTRTHYPVYVCECFELVLWLKARSECTHIMWHRAILCGIQNFTADRTQQPYRKTALTINTHTRARLARTLARHFPLLKGYAPR